MLFERKHSIDGVFHGMKVFYEKYLFDPTVVKINMEYYLDIKMLYKYALNCIDL